MNSWFHAKSAAKKWGGKPEDYIAIEEFIDSSKRIIGDVRHRSLYHHTQGVWLCQEVFGRVILIAKSPYETVDSRNHASYVSIPVRLIAERHIIEDLGWLPSPADYIKSMNIEAWMGGKQFKNMPLSLLMPEREPLPDAQ